MEGDLERKDKKERDLCCKKCASALSELERLGLRDECVFCATKVYTPGSIRLYLFGRLLDWRIYHLKIRLKKKFASNAFYQYKAILGSIGLYAVTDAEKIKRKKELIQALKQML